MISYLKRVKLVKMTLSQLHSLDEDEIALLWFIINKVNPPVVSWEMDPSLFPSINHQKLMDRVLQCEKFIKPEHLSKFSSLKNKLSV